MDESYYNFSADIELNDPSCHVSASDSTHWRSSSSIVPQELPVEEENVQTVWKDSNPSRYKVNKKETERRNGMAWLILIHFERKCLLKWQKSLKDIHANINALKTLMKAIEDKFAYIIICRHYHTNVKRFSKIFDIEY